MSERSNKKCPIYGYPVEVGKMLEVIMKGHAWIHIKCKLIDCTQRAIVCIDVDTNDMVIVPISQIKIFKVM